jgi:antitoxin YefM
LITVSVKEASDKLPYLVENTIEKREPVLISGKKNNAVLMAESDWQAMNETLHLLSVPGIRDAIQSGLSENLESTSRKLNWSCAF